MARKSNSIECEEVHLDGILAEFRIALREEIEAASHHASSNAVPLANGRRIAQIGDNYQYLFDVENALNLPGDTPGDLVVPAHAPIQVTVISVQGLTVTLSIPEDLGSFVPSARLQSNLTYLMRKLIQRIEDMAGTPNPAGNRLLGLEAPSGSSATIADLRSEIDPSQLKAVASGLGRDTTFIWGPPGTGKTRTIGVIGQQLFNSGRSVLIVSHTNVAVDHAIIQVGTAVGDAPCADGKVLRVGDPKDSRLQIDGHELLLKTHVDRRSDALSRRRNSLTEERQSAAKDVLELSRKIDICNWLAESKQDIDTMTEDLNALRNLDAEIDSVRERQSELLSKSSYWNAARKAAEIAKNSRTKIETLEKSIPALESHLSLLSARIQEANQGLAEAKRVLTKAEEIEPLRERLRKLPSPDKQMQEVNHRQAEAAQTGERVKEVSSRLAEALSLYEETSSVGRFVRLWRRLPSPERQKELLDKIQKEKESLSEEHSVALRWLEGSKSLLGIITSIQQQLLPHKDVPTLDSQKQVVAGLESKASACQAEYEDTKHLLAEALAGRDQHLAKVQEFEERYSSSSEDVIRLSELHTTAVTEISQRADSLVRDFARWYSSLERRLREGVIAVQEMGLTNEEATTMETMLSILNGAHRKAATEVEGLALGSLCAQRDQLNVRIRSIEAEIQNIEEALKKVEELVIKEAMVVATTLTRSYLRETIRARRFDTVILDEASMAPIPALWVAAALADKNVIIVGDYHQLPPVVISKHELAEEWLGKDVFEKAGLKDPSNPPSHFVSLQVQYRMHPDISAIPNTLVYQKTLQDGRETRNDKCLDRWYRFDWGYDTPVLLVDTGSADAWVTSVPRGPGSSRLNFLSAALCIDLAQQLLRDDRARFTEGEDPRILIVCPYHPHSRLLDLLLKEHSLKPEVLAGTVHSFQGREADAVILDLVNDAPHWRVGMFMQEHDENMKRLLNVALTRARRRLIVLGDFDYIVKLAKKAFLGAKLIPFLRSRYPCVEALKMVPTGFAARAANAQASVLGGNVEPDSARLVVNQDHFYRILLGDLSRAQHQIVLYSPFITRDRLANLQPQFKAAVERGVMVYVVTKPHCDRNKREIQEYHVLEQSLSDWGVVVIHKRRMHEKLVIIDDCILWFGSLNPLSFSNTQEIMERRNSKKVVADFVRTLWMEDLLKEYKDKPPTCPICKGELVASEGKNEPFYWCCVNSDCKYTRDVDEPPITDGIIRCANCGGEVRYGEWGGKPAWRCIQNQHHHQRIARAHLRLPKMRAIIPKSELRKLDRDFGVRVADGQSDAPRHLGLFDLEGQ